MYIQNKLIIKPIYLILYDTMLKFIIFQRFQLGSIIIIFEKSLVFHCDYAGLDLLNNAQYILMIFL